MSLRRTLTCRSFAAGNAAIFNGPQPVGQETGKKTARKPTGNWEGNRYGHIFRGSSLSAPLARGSGVRWGDGGPRPGCAAIRAAAGGNRAGPEARRPETGRERRARHDAGLASHGRTTSPAAGFHHQTNSDASRTHACLRRYRRFDPPVRRQGRTAGRHCLYRLSTGWRRSRHASRDFPFQWRAGGCVRLSATRQCRTLAAADHQAMRRCLRRRRIFSPMPRPGSTSPISSSSIPSAPAIAVSSPPARTCASIFSRSTATSIRSR